MGFKCWINILEMESIKKDGNFQLNKMDSNVAQ